MQSHTNSCKPWPIHLLPKGQEQQGACTKQLCTWDESTSKRNTRWLLFISAPVGVALHYPGIDSEESLLSRRPLRSRPGNAPWPSPHQWQYRLLLSVLLQQ